MKNNLLKRSMTLIMTIILLAGIIITPGVSLATSIPLEGSGTQADPYLIASAADLVWLDNNFGSSYKYCYYLQVADIDMLDISFTPIGTGDWSDSNNKLTGVYDGGGRTISNLVINSDYDYVGLFSIVEGGKIKNLTMENVTIRGAKAGASVGAFGGSVNTLYGYGLENLSVVGESIIEGPSSGASYVGSIVGKSSNNYIINCYSMATLKSNNTSTFVGGIAGYCGNSAEYTIEKSYFAGSITGSLGSNIGGIIGYNFGTAVGCCFLNTAATYGIGGSSSNSGATPTTSANMKLNATYSGWDSSIWYFNNGVEYPSLRALPPYIKQITINGKPVGTDDTVTVGSRTPGQTVSIYDAASGGNLLGSSMVAPGETSIEINIGKLSGTSGSIYVTANTNARPQTGIRQKVDYLIPGAPTGLTATAGYKSVALSWNAIPGVTSYKIFKGTVSGSYTFDSTVSTNSAVIGNLTNGTPYYFIVRAYTGFESPNSNQATATPYFGAPSNLAATVDNNMVMLTWTGIVGISSYKVYYGTVTGFYSNSVTVNDTSKTITGLTNNQPYYFMVQAIGSEEESASSNEIMATPAPFQFTLPIYVPVNDLSLPNGWASTNLDGGAYPSPLSWSVMTIGDDYHTPEVSPHSAGYMLVANSYYSDDGSKARFHMNGNVSLPASGSYEFSFYMFISDPAQMGYLDSITPQISTNDGVSWSNLGAPILNEQDAFKNQWKKYTYSLDGYKGQSIRLGLLGSSCYGFNMYIDDISVNEVLTVPVAPSNAVAVAGDQSATVSFSAPSYNGGSTITGYTVVPYIGETPQIALAATGTQSPITVSGLTNGTTYFFRVYATNTVGNSLQSSPSNSVTPQQAGPKWASGYPKAGVMGTTTGQVLVKTDSAGKVYYAVVANNAAAPTVAALKSGTVSGSISVGNISITANTEAQIGFTGLTEKTDYDVYVVAEDNASTPVIQPVSAKIDIKRFGTRLCRVLQRSQKIKL